MEQTKLPLGIILEDELDLRGHRRTGVELENLLKIRQERGLCSTVVITVIEIILVYHLKGITADRILKQIAKIVKETGKGSPLCREHENRNKFEVYESKADAEESKRGAQNIRKASQLNNRLLTMDATHHDYNKLKTELEALTTVEVVRGKNLSRLRRAESRHSVQGRKHGIIDSTPLTARIKQDELALEQAIYLAVSDRVIRDGTAIQDGGCNVYGVTLELQEWIHNDEPNVGHMVGFVCETHTAISMVYYKLYFFDPNDDLYKMTFHEHNTQFAAVAAISRWLAQHYPKYRVAKTRVYTSKDALALAQLSLISPSVRFKAM